jgi:CxxC motif-containing protein (DUF1111 family)
MKTRTFTIAGGLVLASAMTTISIGTVAEQRDRDTIRRQRFTATGGVSDEGGGDSPDSLRGRPGQMPVATEALTGFDNETNGFSPQGPPFGSLDEDNVVPLRSFNDNRFIFEETEGIADGLGPTYNAQSCRECHQNVVTGGASQIAEHRTGHLLDGVFFESQGGSLVQSRATHPDAMEIVSFEDDVRTFRISTNTLGAGYVEAISNATLFAIRDAQPPGMRGTAVIVPVLEAEGRSRVGRFGWKSQHASLASFSADAYINEMGITTPTFPEENTAAGRDVGRYDKVADPEDDGVDVDAFADFMRATKAPPRGQVSSEVAAGEEVFNRIGCVTCHVGTIVTAPAGTEINGGVLKVARALGSKAIHPFSDFLLHDIGTGDGIPLQATPEYASTANQIRTAPLWGLRTRNRLMHDGLSFTLQEAITRHAGQALTATQRFDSLSSRQKAALLAFLGSL